MPWSRSASRRSWVSSRVKAYAPTTSAATPTRIEAAVEPVTTSAASITRGHPSVYWEKNPWSLWPVSHGQNRCLNPPSAPKRCPLRSTLTCHW